MKALIAMIALLLMAGCAAPTIYNPGGGGDWGTLSQQVGRQLRHNGG